MEGLYMTDGVKRKIFEDEKFSHFVFKCLRRFMNDDWGELEEEDKRLNDDALKNGDRIMASYNYDKEGKDRVWIIADAEDEEKKRIVTILLPEEY